MIGLDIQSPSLDRLRARWNEVPQIVREELEGGTHTATDESRDLVKSLTPVGPGQPPHTRDQVVSEFRFSGTDRFEGRVTVLTERAQQVMRWLDAGTPAHVIEPRFKKVLRFTAGGRVLFRRVVHHPGTPALRIFERAREEMAPRVRRIFSARLGNVTKRLGHR